MIPLKMAQPFCLAAWRTKSDTLLDESQRLELAAEDGGRIAGEPPVDHGRVDLAEVDAVGEILVAIDAEIRARCRADRPSLSCP